MQTTRDSKRTKGWIWLATIIALMVIAVMVGPMLYEGSDPFGDPQASPDSTLATSIASSAWRDEGSERSR